MKSFKSNAWMLPQPVLIIGTYDKDGRPNAMNAAWGGQWDMHEIMISLGSLRRGETNGQSRCQSRVHRHFRYRRYAGGC